MKKMTIGRWQFRAFTYGWRGYRFARTLLGNSTTWSVQVGRWILSAELAHKSSAQA